MQKSDLKKNCRIKTKKWTMGSNTPMYGRYTGESRERYSRTWEHEVILDEEHTPDKITYQGYKAKYEPFLMDDGNTRYKVWLQSNEITCVVDDKNQPILSKTQERRKREAIKKELGKQQAQDAIDQVIKNFALLGVDSFEGLVQRKYRETKKKCIVIPMDDAKMLASLVQPLVAEQVRGMFELDNPDE